MQSHVVLYKTYSGNPNAADSIIAQAKRFLRDIPGIRVCHIARIIDTGRAVGDHSYDVMLNIIFESARGYRTYMCHHSHLKFVRFVLHGYMFENSTADDPEAEFIEHILRGGTPRKSVRNPAVPDNEVVWADEVVRDAA